MTPPSPGFRCRRNEGFQVTFDNGYTVSVQFGAFHYCSARNMNAKYDDWKDNDVHESSDAEVAIIDPDGEFVPFMTSDDSVRPRTTPIVVANIMTWVASLPSKKVSSNAP